MACASPDSGMVPHPDPMFAKIQKFDTLIPQKQNIKLFIPQTVLALRGSNGVGKGALKCLTRPSRCRSAVFLVKYSTWWHLPSKTHSKIDKIKELLHLAWEAFNFLGSRLVNGLAWTPGGPWPRGSRAEVGQGSIWVKNWRKSESSQNGILYSGKS